MFPPPPGDLRPNSMTSTVFKPRTAGDLGIMRGFPPPPEKRPDLENWDLPPFNRWSFLHVRQLFPTSEVRTDPGNVATLPYNRRELLDLVFQNHDSEQASVKQFLEETYTDGFLVLHNGEIVVEEYFNDMQPHTLHLSQSVAKSIVGTLTGVLVEQGLVDVDEPLVRFVPELAQCGYRDARLIHALDMTSGVKFSEGYNIPDSDMTRIDVAARW